MWLLYVVYVVVLCGCGCGCLQVCTTMLNQSMWLWLFTGVHNDAKPMQCHGKGRVAGVLWTMDGREGL